MATLALGDLPQENLVEVDSASVTAFDASALTVVVCDATSNAITITLPDATAVPAGTGLKVFLKATDAHDVSFATVAPYGSDTAQTINGLDAADFNTTYKLTAAATSKQFVSDSSNWLASAGSL